MPQDQYNSSQGGYCALNVAYLSVLAALPRCTSDGQAARGDISGDIYCEVRMSTSKAHETKR